MTFTHDRVEARNFREELKKEGINVSVTSLSSTRLDMAARGLDSMTRASVHYYNTEEEIARLVEVVGRV